MLIDIIRPEEVRTELVGIGELTPDQEWHIIRNDYSFWQEDHSVLELEMDLEQCETDKREQTIFRILKWMYNLTVDEQEGITKQQVDNSAAG